MNQPIWTVDLLKTLHPDKIANYLLHQGWSQREKFSDKALVWIKPAPEGEFEILLPLNPNAPDFARRLTEVLETLEIVEQRSRSEILNDLAAVQQIAMLMQREVIDLALSFPESFNSYAPMRSLSKILWALQDLIDQIGQFLVTQPNVSPELLECLSEIELAASSIGSHLRLVSALSDELKTSLVSDSLRILITLLSNKGKEFFSAEIAESYTIFLQSLSDAQSGLSVDWGSPKSGYGGAVSLTPEMVQAALNALPNQPQISEFSLPTHSSSF